MKYCVLFVLIDQTPNKVSLLGGKFIQMCHANERGLSDLRVVLLGKIGCALYLLVWAGTAQPV